MQSAKHNFLAFFKLLSVTGFLIFVMDFYYRYNSFSRSCGHLVIWKTAALMWLLMFFLAVVLSIVFLLLAFLLKFIAKREEFVETALQVICASFFSVLFVLYGKAGFAKKIVLGYWNYVLFLVVPLVIIVVCVKRAKLFRERLNNIVVVVWKPLIVLTLISFIWVAPEYTSFQTSSDNNLLYDDELLDLAQLGKETKIKGNKPNIILITFDALSARDMSLYGYYRKTTPYWEELAMESYVFERMHANYTYTDGAVASIFTSKYPWTHTVYHHGKLSQEQIRESVLPLLKKNGYLTLEVLGPVSARHLSSLGLSRGFDYALTLATPFFYFENILDTVRRLTRQVEGNILSLWLQKIYYDIKHSNILPEKQKLKEPPELVFDKIGDVLERIGGSSVFLWTHINAVHLPYWPPPPYKGTYLPENVYLDIRESSCPDFRKLPSGKARQEYADKIRARYDELILYTDATLRSFVEKLKGTGIYNDTILIITADHGEMFEKGLCSSHGCPNLYEPETHIPLLIHTPDQSQGYRIDALAEEVDLAPTILDLIGIPIPSWMEGESLLPYMRGNSPPTNKPKFSMQLEGNSKGHPIQSGFVAVYYGDYKMVKRIGTEHTWIYNLEVDPDETQNLVGKELKTARFLEDIIDGRVGKANEVLSSSSPGKVRQRDY